MPSGGARKNAGRPKVCEDGVYTVGIVLTQAHIDTLDMLAQSSNRSRSSVVRALIDKAILRAKAAVKRDQKKDNAV